MINELTSLEIGDVITSKYNLIKQIGKGGMGNVVLAESKKLKNKWAIKIVKQSYEYAHYILKEAEILEKINHPNIPKIVDLLEDENNIYIVESYVEGIVLSEKIRAEGKIDIDTALKYFIELSELIEYLHNVKPNPIIYRDLKPNNIIVSYNNRLVLVDFSISKFARESEKTVIAGNKYFSSPEQMTLNEHSDTRSDIYSLGMIALRMITGNLNQTIDYSLSKYVEIPAGLKEIIEKCINFNQEDRYQEASDLLEDLLAFRESYNQVSISKKKIVLIDGASNTGKTFVATNLAKYYASKKVKTALIDLSNEIGCGEYIDICIEENIRSVLGEDKLSEIRKKSYRKGKYLEVYKGTVNKEEDLITFLNKISKQSDIVIIDGTSFEAKRLYDFIDEIVLVITQDSKTETLTNKMVINYIDKHVDLSSVKVVVNRFIDGDLAPGELLDNMNAVPKIFKTDSYFKRVSKISEAKRIEILNETKIRSMNIVWNEKTLNGLNKLAEEIYPLQICLSSKEESKKTDKKLLTFKSRKTNIISTKLHSFFKRKELPLVE